MGKYGISPKFPWRNVLIFGEKPLSLENFLRLAKNGEKSQHVTDKIVLLTRLCL